MAFIIRLGTIEDVGALADLHVRTFNETHCGGHPTGPNFALREQQWRAEFESPLDSWFCYVVDEEKGGLVGFAKGRLHDGGVPGFQGELNKIYLLKRVHRQGLGRRMVCSVARQFLQRGVQSMLLFGDANNPSNGFYEAMGAERLYSERGEFHGGYGWRNLHAFIARCAND